MPIENHTDFLDDKMYRRLITNVVMHLTRTPGMPKWFINRWTIRLRPLSQTNEDFFKHTESTSGGKINTGQPSGVTGQYVMDLFLHDEPKMMHFRENADRIQHEICHALLINTEWFVKGVHNKVSPSGGYIKSFKINFWTNRWKVWQRIPITIIDIREHL